MEKEHLGDSMEQGRTKEKRKVYGYKAVGDEKARIRFNEWKIGAKLPDGRVVKIYRKYYVNPSGGEEGLNDMQAVFEDENKIVYSDVTDHGHDIAVNNLEEKLKDIEKK